MRAQLKSLLVIMFLGVLLTLIITAAHTQSTDQPVQEPAASTQQPQAQDGGTAATPSPAATQAPSQDTQVTPPPTGNEPRGGRGGRRFDPSRMPGGFSGGFPGVPMGEGGNPDEMMVSIAYSKADIASVLTFLSMASGVPVVVDSEIKGTVSIISMKRVSLTTAYEVINSALRVRGYTMVGTLKDKVISVVPLKKAVSGKVEVRVGTEVKDVRSNDSYVTQVVPLLYANATKLKDELKPLVSDDQANILAISGSNTLVITDTEGNIRRLLQIINLLDQDNTDVITVEIYRCEYASAAALATALEKVFTVTKSTTQQQSQPNRGQPQPNNPNQPGAASDDGLLSMKGELHVAADDRTNSLIISASPKRVAKVIELVKQLDVDTTSAVRAKIFKLKNADAKAVADQMTKVFEQPSGSSTGLGRFMPRTTSTTTADAFSGLKQNTVVPDVRTNSVIVTATEQNMKEFEKMIIELDTPTVLSDVTRTFKLKSATARTAASTLTSLFRGSGRGSGNSFFDLISGNTSAGDPISSLRNITVVADEKSNTLLITGPPQSFSMVEEIIKAIDQDQLQVFIEVAIVDVTLDDTNKFGLEWTWNSDARVPGTTTPESSVGTNFGLSSENTGLRYKVISDNLQVLLRALETRSDVKVYSTPSITTANNVQASISIGTDEPYVKSEEETSAGNLRRTFDYKNVSIALVVTPHVNSQDGLISLDVQQTINELIGRDLELNAPIIANRQARTTVMVRDGQTIVIGGIIKENKQKEVVGVPVLSKIPLLGELFKSRETVTQKSELMVFLTPRILINNEDLTEKHPVMTVDQVTEQQRGKLSDQRELLKETTNTPHSTPAMPEK